MNYQSAAYPWDQSKHELIGRLITQLNSQRKALKRKRVFRNKLGDIAASQFMAQGIKSDNS
jgi:hypothetical protein